MEWHLLPLQMRARNQWVCADDKKQPRNPLTGELAESNNFETWGTFESATKSAIANGWDLGFMLSDDDPYTIVDLDNKPHNPAPPAMLRVHADILQNAETYIERSTSGTGYHVIVEGTATKSIKTQWIEMYSSHRLMICTGDVVKDLPVANGQQLIALIDQHFGKENTYVDPMGDLPDQAPDKDELPDEEIIRRGIDAENGDKFLRLYEGSLDDYNGDHSRADSALLNLLCFLTPHNEQVRRIFRSSKLYRPNQRNRTTNKYLNYSILKWREENPPININDYSLDIKEGRYEEPEPPVPPKVPKAPAKKEVPSVPLPVADLPAAPMPSPLEFPPGIIGDMATWIFKTAYIPMAESALVAALGYAAGLIGRGFHINGLGLNQYIVLIADSGEGKEGGKKGIRAIHNRVYQKVPASMNAIGSSDFSAGVSMVKELAEFPCMLGVAGEIGVTLRGMLDPRANQNIKDLKRALTDAWSESGPHGLLNGRKYSDKSKNGGDVRRPCLSIIGESVPSHFYGALSVDVINDGFIPRWIVYEHSGAQADVNRDGWFEPDESLIERLSDLYVASKTVQDSNQMTEVKFATDAKKAFHKFEDSVRAKARSMPTEHPLKAILNRTNEKALKVAGLLAATINPHQPVVSLEVATWAMKFIERADGFMVNRFEDGSVGEGEDSFDGLMRKFIRAYAMMSAAQKQAHKCPKCLLDSPAISHSSLSFFLKQRAAIKNHRNGALKAIEIAISDAILTGLLVKMPNSEKQKVGMRGGEAYLLGSGW